jgi:hypothetical protein
MKSISTTINSGDTPTQQAASADVNAVMGAKKVDNKNLIG